MAVNINTDDCIACGICVDECPQDALTVNDVCEVDADAASAARVFCIHRKLRETTSCGFAGNHLRRRTCYS